MEGCPLYSDLTSDRIFLNILRKTAAAEQIPVARLLADIRRGVSVITLNKNRKISRPCAIGKNLATKINVNIGTSTDKNDLTKELKKLELAVKLNADAVMDLSLGGDLRKIRRKILAESPLPVGTVPVYEAAMNAQRREGSFLRMSKNEIFDTLTEQAEAGVDFFTIHCGINQRSLGVFLKHRRLMDVVSRGGALLIRWMRAHNKENPFYEYFDEILTLAKKHRLTLSLGDGMRPGSIIDATDAAQISELKELGKLTLRARQAGVQVIVEGPGHVPLHEVAENMALEKKICHGAPFYVLGPLVTDVALGYDHIAGAIGGAIAAMSGADFLCYLTPAEHVRHPSLDDVRDGIIASKIAAHAADIAKRIPGARDWDRKLSLARKNRKWTDQIRLAMDPEKAERYRRSSHPKIEDACTMCGEFCSIRMIDECLGKQG